MSDTPRTDLFAKEARKGDSFKAHILSLEDFARQLERELAQTREQLRLANIDQANTEAEVNTAKEAVDSLLARNIKLSEELDKLKALLRMAEVWTDWQNPVMKGYRMECCGCGLVHEVEFRIGKVTELHADGKGWEGELMPEGEYRVQMRLRRV